MMAKMLDLMREGGAVMWPILLLSVAGLTIVFERLWTFHRFFRGKLELAGSPQSRLNQLQRGFGVLGTIISAEPMLGILGTVTGIIQTFGAFRASDSAAPLAATAGIGEALVTTAAGLVAALVLLFPYNLLLGLLARAAERLERE